MTHPEKPLTWFKSSYSGGNEGQCVEVADARMAHATVGVRDSKDLGGLALWLRPVAFTTFVTAIADGTV
ncbi:MULTISPECIES: DUF397 domain-containing protein [unclassified Streptomyces]|uniref:DUF397 domain-containing protein n=1 Tax=unclassified Streptomyces TaxID=2593676 RepID=UPI0038131F08